MTGKSILSLKWISFLTLSSANIATESWENNSSHRRCLSYLWYTRISPFQSPRATYDH
eukprot:UN26832